MIQVIGNFVKSNVTGPNQMDNASEKLEVFAPGSFDGTKFDLWPVDVIRCVYAVIVAVAYDC